MYWSCSMSFQPLLQPRIAAGFAQRESYSDPRELTRDTLASPVRARALPLTGKGVQKFARRGMMPVGAGGAIVAPMCGRFYLTAAAAEIKKKFNLDQAIDLAPRYNIAPTQSSPIVVGAAKNRSVHMA